MSTFNEATQLLAQVRQHLQATDVRSAFSSLGELERTINDLRELYESTEQRADTSQLNLFSGGQPVMVSAPAKDLPLKWDDLGPALGTWPTVSFALGDDIPPSVSNVNFSCIDQKTGNRLVLEESDRRFEIRITENGPVIRRVRNLSVRRVITGGSVWSAGPEICQLNSVPVDDHCYTLDEVATYKKGPVCST